ncbi:MAG: histidine phosphatase family protein [Patescibacteria group bacterium]
MLSIYLARHGQDEDNAQGILNGHRNRPLTALGLEQATSLANFIKEAGLTFDAVYSSPLIRAQETALTVTSALNLSNPIILPELIERDFGVMTGQKITDIKKMCAPDIIQAEIITYFLSPDGAETFPDLIVRGQKILDIIKAKHQTGKILLVSHGDIGKMIYAAYYNLSWEKVLTDFHFGNTGLILLSEEQTTDNFVFKTKQFNK